MNNHFNEEELHSVVNTSGWGVGVQVADAAESCVSEIRAPSVQH